ncbi:hypothetical protein FA95DRAFT_1612723 [Auriscalpium vulgare]|uniref:Uncharacterized protein n=1 Tax=Auriscalpium vulgare TaxID=40419 RepID=A0ACB8R592_9AGAM|nr:hypothetical protein FA95DRAFT_1612723 [Auriscalpium vulgare]
MTRKRPGRRARNAVLVPMDVDESPPLPRARHTNVTVRNQSKPSQSTSHHLVSAQPPLLPDAVVATSDPPPHSVENQDAEEHTHGEVYIEDMLEYMGHRQKRRRRGGVRRKKNRVALLNEWLPLRDQYVDELIRHDGRGDYHSTDKCSACGIAAGTSRCIDCLGSPPLCNGCLCAGHVNNPLHRVQRWNENFFEKYSLAEAGLCIQLGHDNLSCPNPRPTTTNLTVIDTSGVHRVVVRFCDCGSLDTAKTYVQCLRARWWPATVKRPRTVVTLRTCELFHALTLQGKMNAYDFWHGLSRVTDGSGLAAPKDQYKDFIRIMRCFRHVRMAKRGGRGHDPGGLAATEVGELVVECPACPQPGRNIPDGWDLVPADEQWKYAVMLAIDANFKLKLKNCGLADVSLSAGWAYFVENGPYKEHVAKYIDQEEMKCCDSSFAARDHANMPTHKRFAINGVGAVICARHCFYRKSGIVDLQRGERYCNMDYAVFSTIARTASGIKVIVLSYDIACQFSKNFLLRMQQYPEGLRINVDGVTLIFVVPKFHLLAHGQSCQVEFNLNYTEGVGRTCGEGIESGWADTNGSALSTREMSPEGRHEGLDDFFGAINWRKTLSLGKLLARSLKAAVAALAEQKAVLEDSNITIPLAIRERWEGMVLAWDADHSRPNAYDEPEAVTTLADVRLELALEESAEANTDVMSLHETSASVFLAVGLELEDLQYAIRMQAKDNESKTPVGKVTLQEKRNALQHRIRSWQVIQKIYMPAVAALLAASVSAEPSELTPPTVASAMPASSDATSAIPTASHLEPIAAGSTHAVTLTIPSATAPIKDEPLYLPSSIPEDMWSQGLSLGLIVKYRRLRVGQAEDTLYNIRRLLRLRTGLIHYKHVFVDGPGQNLNTRARNQIARLQARIKRYVVQYRMARAALLVIWPDGPWMARLQELLDEHVRAPRENKEGPGDGHRALAWIWRALPHEARDVPGHQDDMTEDEVHEGLRVDWVRTRMRR